MRRLSSVLLAFTAAAIAAPAAPAAPAGAQQAAAAPADTAGAFHDAGAAALLYRARDARQRSDRSIRSYTAVVRSRLAAGMRMPMKDRTLFRQETAARVRWSRDATSVVQLIGLRTQTPAGVEGAHSASGLGIDELFDPSHDRLYFGLTPDTARSRGSDDYWIEHPLGDESERHYRYRTGDTLVIRLMDGREIRVLELVVTPRRDDPHTVVGTLWLDAASGALVQAAFRLARRVDLLRDMDVIDDDDLEDIGKVPGFLKPFEFDISLMTIEYSLWELKHWLPRSMRFAGMMRAGVLAFPGEVAVSYDMEEILLDGETDVPEAELARETAAAWGVDDPSTYRFVNRRSDGRPYTVITPRDTLRLLNSTQLPPAVWSNAPGFTTEAELRQIYDRLATLAPVRMRREPVRIGWGLGEPDMLRYNRVEALSVGARVTAPLPQAELSAVARIGAGDLHPNIELLAHRESLRRTLQLRAYHALRGVDESRNALGLGNSMSALLFGRDEGEYYRASGAALTWAPPPARRRTWDVTGYAEYQNDVARGTHVAMPRLWQDTVFRPNITADEATQYGAMLRLRPWWGTDPLRAQFGIDVMLQAETGDFEHARGRVTLRAASPTFHGIRLGAEAGVGTAEGAVPVQRLFYLGGASTLRGYEPGTVVGTSMARARLEVARAYSAGNISLFGDWGWAGDRADLNGGIDRAQERIAAGIGVSLLDGLVRLDLARGLRAPTGWRLDLHMDAIL